ncbi:MAG: LamG domain-containing protein [Halieaceae bacterium]
MAYLNTIAAPFSNPLRVGVAACVLMLLQACSGGSGGGGSVREVDLTADPGSSEFSYEGPAPASDDIQDFKREFYDPLAGNDRCGQCHTPGGTGSNKFVDQTDVNQAWQEARAVVNLLDPAASAVVQRVANGHNCWLGASQAATCATTITGYVERWAEGVSEFQSEVKLLPRPAVDPSSTKSLPPELDDLLAMGAQLDNPGELMDLLNRYCDECHADDAVIPQSPYFASNDPLIAYPALRGVIDLVDPYASRIVLRLDPESHNCWDSCPNNADTLGAAVTRIADLVPEAEVDPQLVVSKAQILERDGIIANSGGRFETNLVAKWEFREGSGTTTADTSGVQPEIPLSLSGDYSWMGSWGVRLVNGKAQGSVNGSAKLYDLLTGTGEYSIEAWVAPNNVSQEEAWIFGYAGGPENRNLLLSQTLYNYEFFNRSTATEGNNSGSPPLATADDDERAQATLQHVVLTYDPVSGRKIYVNGEDTGDVDEAGGGLLNNWSEVFAIVLGNDTSNSHPWAGAIRMVAIHNATLTPEQIIQNFDVGVGQKYFLMFSVSELIDGAGVGAAAAQETDCASIDESDKRTNYCYVVFQVSQFDDSAYLFETPFFANINPAGSNVDFDVRGIRIGINGKLAQIGQGFTNVAAVASSSLGAISEPLAETGTIIPLENGTDQDIFFLAFDAANGLNSPIDDGELKAFRYSLPGQPSSDIGMRTFDEINATFSALTGVPTASPTPSVVTGKTVAETYNTIRRQLPSVEDFQGFQSSHHMAATQLAAAYCDALVQDVALRETLFPAPPAFDFNRPVADPAIDWRNHIVAPLVDRAINTGLVADSYRDGMLDELELLITDSRDLKPFALINGQWLPDPDPALHNKRDGLIYCLNDATCPASRTADVVKATCTAVLGSAMVLAQ